MKILSFINEKWGRIPAQNFIDDVDSMIRVISNMPESFPVYYKGGGNVRKCVINKRTVLFYQIKARTINLINMYDTRMDPDRFKF